MRGRIVSKESSEIINAVDFRGAPRSNFPRSYHFTSCDVRSGALPYNDGFANSAAMIRPPLISLRDVGKDYPLTQHAVQRAGMLYSLLRQRPPQHVFRALSGISFDVFRGQSLGLVGENGAGKSTLLKTIAGVVRPTRGTLAINGRIGALLELGAGFHPEYTGRENVFLAAALMGMTRAETLTRLDEILAFADIGAHVDQPIKHYSSGMVVRLGFAIASTMRPDILITDEVLAVGDESFQKKCIVWMERYLADGGTLLLCSHSMFHIQKLCHNAAWIHHGEMRMFGSAGDVAREYLAYHEDKYRQTRQQQPQLAVASGVYQARSLTLNGCDDDEGTALAIGDRLEIRGTVFSPDGRVPSVALGIVRADGTPVYGLVSDMDGFALTPAGPDLFGYALILPNLPLLPGRYYVRAHAMDPEGMRLFDQLERRFDITGQTRELGMCRIEHAWQPYA